MSSVRSGRSASRRRAILDATLQLYTEAGPEALSIEAIGALSGASVGSIYHHFKNKDGVLAALHSQLLEDYRTAIRARLEAALATHCYGKDRDDRWVKQNTLVGYDSGPYQARPDRTLSAQRGLHYPQPPAGVVPDSVGFPQ